MTFVGHDVEAQRMEIMELQGGALVLLSDPLHFHCLPGQQ